MRLTLNTSGRARAVALLRRLTALLLALVLLPAYAAGPANRSAPGRNPPLASLQIEIWPEYDRPAALVIFRGALGADAALPAQLTLRIPAASGGPSAMAYSAADGGNLLNLEYERADAGEFITLHFKLPQRFFHVEFYDPLATSTPQRSFTYVWPGDMEVKRLSVIVQEPAAASNFSVQPALGDSATGQGGLRLRSADLGTQAAGKPLPIRVSYSKTDQRTSAEILRPKSADPAPALAASVGTSPGNDVTKGVLIFVLALSLLIGLASAVLWWRGRAQAPARPTIALGAGSCAKCGTPRIAGGRYCHHCGARHK